MEELPPLFHEHWLEVGLHRKQIPLDPDWKRYQDMDAGGQLHMITVRDEGILVGYYLAIVWTHLHYKTSKTAWSDLLFILPGYRATGRGMVNTGYELLKYMETSLKSAGVQRTYLMTKAHLPINILMKRLKYRLIERVFSKLL